MTGASPPAGLRSREKSQQRHYALIASEAAVVPLPDPPPGRQEEKLILRLHRRKERTAKGLFLAEGVRVVEELLAARRPVHLAIASNELENSPRGASLLAALRRASILRAVPAHQFQRLATTTSPQGILAIAEIPRYAMEALQVDDHATILVLDAIQDPGNFGTLVRSAYALGAACVVALPGCVDPWNPKTVRSAAGASFRLPVIEARPEAVLHWLRREGFEILGADPAGRPADSFRPLRRSALVIGNEGAGLSSAMREHLDATIAVPIRTGADSLNAAVAAGILLFLLRQGRET